MQTAPQSNPADSLDCDILISGGGAAGLIAAAAFGAEGFSVICCDPTPPVTAEAAQGADLRTTAFLHPSRALLARAGLWDRFAPHVAPLQIMQIIDAGGAQSRARLTRAFDAADISDEPFGWNLPNWLIRREAMAALDALPNVTFLAGVATTALTTRSTEARVTLSDGRHVTTRLVVAADGRNSAMRAAAGIPVSTTRYGQKAVVCTVTHPTPHQNISTEVHRWGGPFTLVPLPDRDGSPSSAVVWMERAAEADRLVALPMDDFTEALNERSTGVLGQLTPVTARQSWPIISQIARRFHGERLALIAEAAHVVPPIGAQGLNMSLADLADLVDLCVAHRADPGTAPMLARFTRDRWLEVKARVTGIDALNRASMVSARPLRDLRAAALGALYAIKPVRRTMMRAGLGMR
ncbi:UbiH/UbiF family hydroxylase [Paracoccus sp. p3-h83]|uniref:UbiH/UbiF family hydroxylase n=1 Tax=Paracoccus sp. p3-h83 TaxID=3342805 RepID=UPI0035B9ADE7